MHQSCDRLTFVLGQISLVDGLLDLVVGPLGVQVHGPAKVHQRQVGLAQLLVHLGVRRQWSGGHIDVKY